MTDLTALKTANAARWEKAQILPARELQVEKVAAALCAPKAKAIYQTIEKATGVPWFVVAVIHEREAAQNFGRSIAQGDPWNEPSVHVPRGIGPFKSFYDAAVFALTRCAPFAARWTDWSAGGTLTLLELYNGIGYDEYHHEASPYDWGATTMEQEGKYIADGKWSATVWDTQVGCAAMLKAMMAIDTSITFASTGAAPAAPIADAAKPASAAPSPSIVPAAKPADPAPGATPEIPAEILAALHNLFAAINARLATS